MAKKLIAYFSACGTTRKVAEALAAADSADLFEIVPCQLYTKEDLDWTNKDSRSTVEMKDKSSRPCIAKKLENAADYDTVFIGFPIWWGREPSVVDTFLDETDLSGKTIVPFCTSGGSDVSGAVASIKEICGGKATVIDGIRLAGDVSKEDLKTWETGLGL